MKSVVKVIGIVLLVLIVVFLVGKDRFISRIVENTMEQQTGFPCDIGRVHVGVIAPVITIDSFKIQNPDSFGDGSAFELEELTLRYMPLSILTKTVKFKEITMRIPEVVVVRNEERETNIERMIKNVQEGQPDKGQPTPEDKEGEKGPDKDNEKPEKEKSYLIRNLTFELGTVVYRDYSKGRGEPRIDRYEVNTEKTYQDVTSAQDVIAQITTSIIMDRITSSLNKFSDENKDEIDKFQNSLNQNIGSFIKGLKGE